MTPDQEPTGVGQPADTTDWDEVGFAISSRYRTATLAALAEQPQTPGEIAERSGYAIAHISREMRRLRDRDHAELLVSEDTKKGRIYGLTDSGEALTDTLADSGRLPEWYDGDGEGSNAE